MKVFYSIKKEMLEIIHDKTMLTVLIAFPIFIMLFLGSSFGSIEINGLPIGIVGPYDAGLSSSLFSDLNDSTAFNLISFKTEKVAMENFRNGKLRAVIVVPEDIEKKLGEGYGSKIRILVDNSDIALQEAILAAMGSVVQASSTEITKDYVVSAWEDLAKLNESASVLESNILLSKVQMEKTKQNIQGIREGINGAGIKNLGISLEETKEKLSELSEISTDEELTNSSFEFLNDAETALNESLDTIAITYDELIDQDNDLKKTINDLDTAISAIGLIKNSTTDPITSSALEANIIALTSLRNSTMNQKNSLNEQIIEIIELNSSLNEFKLRLIDYTSKIEDANINQELKISEFREKINGLNDSIAKAKVTIIELEDMFNRINGTTNEIEGALDDVANQIDSVEGLIISLKDTVNEQTAKDPEKIASPLEVSVEGQYKRKSFVDFIIPQVIGVSLLFSCFLLASISFVREKTRKTIIRLRLIPGAFTNSIAAKIATITLISILQVGMILIIGYSLFAVEPPSSIIMLILGTIISALVLSSIGIVIGFIAKTESAAIQSSLIIAIPMLFLGNIIFSPDLLPSYTQLLLEFLPLSHITNIFKIVLITGGNPISSIIALLTYFGVLLAAIAFMVYKMRDIISY